MKHVWIVVVAGFAVWAPIAEGAAKRTTHAAHFGFAERAGGVGCTQAQVVARVDNSGVVRVKPDEGDSVGLAAEVLAVATAPGEIRWTVGPTPATCANYDVVDGPGNWSWSTWDDTSWSVVFRRRAYAVTASPSGGIRSIAGFRVHRRDRRSAPVVARVRRALGRPTSIRRGRGAADVTCTARWRKLGLKVLFVNFGLAPPCRDGFLQTATIAGPAARGWIAAIGRNPAIVPGTSLDWLEEQSIGSENEFGVRAWTLADVYFPVGASGFVPSVSALFTGSGRLVGSDLVRGFDLWVGAGGD